MKILSLLIIWLSLSFAAHANQPIHKTGALKGRQNTAISIKSAEKYKNLKQAKVDLRTIKNVKQPTVKVKTKRGNRSRKNTPDNKSISSGIMPHSTEQKSSSDLIEAENTKVAETIIQADDFTVGMQNYRERRYEEAISALCRYASSSPKSEQRMAALLIIGKSLEEMNRLRSALNIYSVVVETAPDSPEALLGIVAMADIAVANPDIKYVSSKKVGEYIRDPLSAYDFVLSKNTPPQVIEHIHYNRGLVLLNTRRYEKARNASLVFLKKFPQTAYQNKCIGIIRNSTKALIDQYYRLGDHIAVANLILQSWDDEFVRPDDIDTLIKSSYSLYYLGLYEKSLDILNTLKKHPLSTLAPYIDEIDTLASKISEDSNPGPPVQTAADTKWIHFQTGRKFLATHQPALAEEALNPLKMSDVDPFWSKLVDYIVEDHRWTQKYKEQIGQ